MCHFPVKFYCYFNVISFIIFLATLNALAFLLVDYKKVTNRHPACPVAKRKREAYAKDLLMAQSSIDEMFR